MEQEQGLSSELQTKIGKAIFYITTAVSIWFFYCVGGAPRLQWRRAAGRAVGIWARGARKD